MSQVQEMQTIRFPTDSTLKHLFHSPKSLKNAMCPKSGNLTKKRSKYSPQDAISEIRTNLLETK